MKFSAGLARGRPRGNAWVNCRPGRDASARLIAAGQCSSAVDAARYVNYRSHMLEILKTQEFERWIKALRDRAARVRVQARIDRLAFGNPGQHRVLTGGVTEMKIDFGPGYRVYFAKRGTRLVLLLAGGDKATQQQDIELAMRLAKEWQE